MSSSPPPQYSAAKFPLHRDIKSSNILLSEQGVAKIADVGLAKMLNQAGHQSVDNAAGTFNYAAPELLRGGPCTYRVRHLLNSLKP